MVATASLLALSVLQLGGINFIGLAVAFLVLALVAYVLGAQEIAGLSMEIVRILVLIFIVLFVVSLILNFI